MTACPASGHRHSGRAAGVAVELFTASASQRAVLRSYGDSETQRLGREPEGNALHPSWHGVGSRVGPREPQSALLSAPSPGTRDPGGPALTCSLLMAARTCEPRTAGLDRCCGTLKAETKVSTAGQLAQSLLSLSWEL